MKKYYDLNQSPFYKLSNKRKLSKILLTTPHIIQKIIRNEDKNYKIAKIKDKKGKIRNTEISTPFLKKIHLKITKLLTNIKPPNYLHSATKERSYKTNAEIHKGNHNVAKTDISNFYPSIKFNSVFHFFNNTMLCSSDVSYIIAKLCTCKLDKEHFHIPLGSPLSPILSYYANKKMFDEINEISNKNNVIMTLYIDDLTFSGKNSHKVQWQARKILYKYGYKTKEKKNIKYSAAQIKEITGVIVKNNQLKLPNRRHKKIYDLIQKLNSIKNQKEKIKIYNELVGRLREGQQFCPKLNNILKEFLKHPV